MTKYNTSKRLANCSLAYALTRKKKYFTKKIVYNRTVRYLKG